MNLNNMSYYLFATIIFSVNHNNLENLKGLLQVGHPYSYPWS